MRANNILIYVLGAVGLTGVILFIRSSKNVMTENINTPVFETYKTGGDSLNNVGNIRNVKGHETFKGEVITNSVEGSFLSFKTSLYGTRAMFKTLKTYIDIHNVNTVERIIRRYAPTSENDTDNYINFVMSYLPDYITRQTQISFDDKSTMLQIGKAISKMENNITMPDILITTAYDAV